MENTEKSTIKVVGAWGEIPLSDYLGKPKLIPYEALKEEYKRIVTSGGLRPQQIKWVNNTLVDAIQYHSSQVYFRDHKHSQTHLSEDGDFTYDQMLTLYDFLRHEGYKCLVTHMERDKALTIKVDLQDLYEVNSEE